MELNTIDTTVTKEVRPDGSILMRSTVPLEPDSPQVDQPPHALGKGSCRQDFFGSTIAKDKSKRQLGIGDICRRIRKSKKYFASTTQ